MPVSAYFNGNGDEVMANMTKEYGPKKGKSVFYATANKRKKKPGMKDHLLAMKAQGHFSKGSK